jgi:uncharacterized protein YbaP (TraB family)
MRALVAFVVAIAGCTKAPQCTLAPVAAAKGPAFLWRVQKPTGGDVLWLYGTIHDTGMESVPRVALDALEHSVRVVTELGATAPDPEIVREHAFLRRGPGIDQRLLEGDWYDLRDALRGVIAEDALRRAAPWFAMSLLTTHMSPSPGLPMDALLGRRAQELAMPVEALETWDEQYAMLDSTVTIDDLQQAIEARDTMVCDLDRMTRSYEAGDTDTMTAFLVVPRTAEPMLYARNRKWLPKLETYFDKGGAFVAVGLGHMLGDQGLPALLARDGYIVERTTAR